MKLQLEIIIFIFVTKFAQKQYFWYKAKKARITIAFCIFKSVFIPNFMSKEEFRFF